MLVAHPEVDIVNLTREGASEIARKDYWEAIMGDSLPWPLNIVMADFAFHSGPGRALKDLAREVGLAPDDIALDELSAKANSIAASIGATVLAEHVHLRRLDLLITLVQGNAAQLRFLKGWMRRILRLAFLFD
jgi:lysozyme family protein